MDPATASPPGSARMLAPQIREAEERRLAGEAGRAIAFLQEVLELAPWAPAALAVLARIHWEAGRLGPASVLLERIAAVDPANQTAVRDAARVALQRGEVFAALRHGRAAVRGDPLSPDAHHLLGLALTAANRPVPGEHHYRRALELAGTREPSVLGNLAWNLKTQGRIAESRAVYAELRALGAAPPGVRLGEARMEEAAGALDRAAEVLDEAEAASPGDAGVTLARAVVAARRGAREHALSLLDGMGAAEPTVLMEKGRLLDRMGRPEEAFAAWTEGKRLLREATGQAYGAAEAASEAARLRGFFTPERRRLLPRAPVAEGPQPIFILGFPRSGTTLVEQTLSAHPAVAAGDELPLVGDLAGMVPRVLSSPLGYPEALADLWMGDEADGLETLRDHYLRRVRGMGILGPGQAWFTDKMPLNEWHLGLIGMVFPASPLILLVRHPADVVLSVFGNELTHGFHCAFSLEGAATHLALASELVAHYRASLALRLLPVRYEDLVDDQEATVRRMLDFVGLPFDPACLAPQENRRYARTASYAQVTEKLYDRSRGRWRAYREQLTPVWPILAPAMARLGYGDE